MTDGTVKKEGQVASKIIKQRNLTSELLEFISKLEARLVNVLQVKTPPPEAVGEATEQIVPLAAEICNSTNVVQECIINIRSILDRLEV